MSSTLIRVPGWGNIILDAGEGTLGQIARYFGINPDTPLNLSTILMETRCIFLSHIHADHMIGAARLLGFRSAVGRTCFGCLNFAQPLQLMGSSTLKPLYLICNNFIHRSLRDYSQLEDLGFSSQKVMHIDSKDHALRFCPSESVNSHDEPIRRVLLFPPFQWILTTGG